jgi:hypothetical protein
MLKLALITLSTSQQGTKKLRLDPLAPCKGTSIHFLTYPLLSYYPPHLPLSICILPIPLHHLQGPHSKADNFPEVDSRNVINFPHPPPLVP